MNATGTLGARYYEPNWGRFTTPDPLGGDIYNPQSLNRYAYAWDNPVTMTDPTGMYVCADSAATKTSKGCTSKQDQAFATALAHDLASNDAQTVRAAEAYGKVNVDNGVTIAFGDPGSGASGITKPGTRADGSGLSATALVTLRPELGGAGLDAVVGHEGVHVANAQAAARTLFWAGPARGWQSTNPQLDLTQYQNEFEAYEVTAAVLSGEGAARVFDGQKLGWGIAPGATAQAINAMLGDTSWIYRGTTPAEPGPRIYALGVPH